jgi:hypothetical protein
LSPLSSISRPQYKYKLNIFGATTYLNLLCLYKQGRELNLRKMQRGKPPLKIDSYMGETRPIRELND